MKILGITQKIPPQTKKDFALKLVPAIFYQISIFHQMIALQKL